MVVEIAEATLALQRHAPQMSTALSQWLQHSNVELVIPVQGAKDPASYTIDFGTSLLTP